MKARMRYVNSIIDVVGPDKNGKYHYINHMGDLDYLFPDAIDLPEQQIENQEQKETITFKNPKRAILEFE